MLTYRIIYEILSLEIKMYVTVLIEPIYTNFISSILEGSGPFAWYNTVAIIARIITSKLGMLLVSCQNATPRFLRFIVNNYTNHLENYDHSSQIM